MMRNLLKSKIHRATVTEANITYEGSITIDKSLMEAADILQWEQVQVYNISNGERFTTYAIEGRPGDGTICVNGAAARLASPGDLIIIVAYTTLSGEEAARFQPAVVFVDENNRVKNISKAAS